MFAMGQRGISGHELAHKAGITPETFSRAMRGYRVYPRTAQRLMDALLATRIIAGSEVLLVSPATKKSSDTNGQDDVRPPVVPVRTARRPLWPDEGTPPAEVGGLRVIEERPKKSVAQPAPTPTAPSRK